MHQTLRSLIFTALGFAAAGCVAASAQAIPTASAPLSFSAFAGVSGVYTGLNSGRNLSLTAGVDLGFLPGHHYAPALEYRGTFALDKGSVDGQKSQLAGLKVAFQHKLLHPYADVFVGRAEINYLGAGLEVPGKPIYYTQSSTNVFAGGGGVDLALSSNFAFKADVLLQRYATPVTASGRIYPTAITLGVDYRFRLNHTPKK